MFMRRAREQVKAALMSRDMLLSGVAKSIEDLDRVINLLGERLEDWYGIYFPEMKLDDRMKYAQLVVYIDRSNPDLKEMASLVGQKKAEEIAEIAGKSLGASLDESDLEQCRRFAGSIIELDKLRENFEKYQNGLANQLCPNTSIVAGPEIAAKLVAHVGSLARLSVLPASTIQVLGAEKALFKHLKNRRIKPPKHGIIFQHPKISGSPKSVRGRIARALAAKIAIATKADAFTKRDISSELLADFEKRYEQIMEDYKKEKGKAELSRQKVVNSKPGSSE